MKDSTIRLLIQGVIVVTSLILLGVIGIVSPNSDIIKILEYVLIGGVSFFLGHQAGKSNGEVSKNGQ